MTEGAMMVVYVGLPLALLTILALTFLATRY